MLLDSAVLVMLRVYLQIYVEHSDLFGSSTVGAANASPNLGAAPKPTDTPLRFLDLLSVAASDTGAFCTEGRRVSGAGGQVCVALP